MYKRSFLYNSKNLICLFILTCLIFTTLSTDRLRKKKIKYAKTTNFGKFKIIKEIIRPENDKRSYYSFLYKKMEVLVIRGKTTLT
jgi:hypothetical protein